MQAREYWMFYRGPGFVAVVWFGSSPPPPPPSPGSKLSLFLSLPVCSWSSLLSGEGAMGRAMIQIIQPRGSLALYKSCNTQIQRSRGQILADVMDAEKVPFQLKSWLFSPKSRLLGSKSRLFSWKGTSLASIFSLRIQSLDQLRKSTMDQLPN
jgi:hypothetical protein